MAVQLDLDGRVVLVCGVARGGIGGATARRVAAAGAQVFAVDHLQEKVDQTVADIEAAGGACEGFVADLTDPSQCARVIPAVTKRFGRVDGVANVSGGLQEHQWQRLERTSDAVFREVVNLNFEYVFRMCRDAAAWMIDEGRSGSIVNVSSVSANTSAPYHGPYGAAKAAIAALTRTMAHEWKPYGIRANSVSPGNVPSEAVREMRAWGGKTHLPLAKNEAGVTTPDQLADAIAFLLSDLSSGIWGQTIAVDGSASTAFCCGTRESFAQYIYEGA